MQDQNADIDPKTMERIVNLEQRMTGTPVVKINQNLQNMRKSPQQQQQQSSQQFSSDEKNQNQNFHNSRKLSSPISKQFNQQQQNQLVNGEHNTNQIQVKKSLQYKWEAKNNTNKKSPHSDQIMKNNNFLGNNLQSNTNTGQEFSQSKQINNRKRKVQNNTNNAEGYKKYPKQGGGSRSSSADSIDGSLKCNERWADENQNKRLTDYFTKQDKKRSNSKPSEKFLQSLKRKPQQKGSASPITSKHNPNQSNQFISLGGNVSNGNSNNLFENSVSQNKSSLNVNKGNPIFDNQVVKPKEEWYNQKINELEDNLTSKQQKINRQDTEIKKIKQEYEKCYKYIQDQEQVFQNYKTKVMLLTAKNKIQIEKQNRQERKNYILAQKTRLGEIIQQRDGTKFQDVWKEGQEFIKVRERLSEIQNEREELERQKKLLKNDKDKKKNQNQNSNSLQPSLYAYIDQDSNSNFDLTSEEKKQIIEYQIQALKREEQQLNERKQQLDHEKLMLIQKMKLDFEEANSRYGRSDIPLEDQWPIISSRYQLLSLLGKGGFSEVYKAFDLEELKQVACKIHQLNPNWQEKSKINYIKHALRETEIHKQLNHPNIVRLYDSVEIDNDSFCTMLEYCEGPDLSYYLKEQKAIPEKEAKCLIKQILSGLRYMHNYKQKVIHYDLKPQNIIFHRGQLKISDFGLCKIIQDEDATRLELTSQGVGTYWYLPPETFQSGETVEVGTKVDVWSLGVIFFEMIYGQRPFGHGMSQDKVLKEGIILKATNVNFPMKSPAQTASVTKECQDFIRKCLTYRMEDRWDINEAFACAYMQKK